MVLKKMDAKTLVEVDAYEKKHNVRTPGSCINFEPPNMAIGQKPGTFCSPQVIAGLFIMFIPLELIIIGIDPYPYNTYRKSPYLIGK